MTEVEPLYTLESAATRLGVTRETVREWIANRGLRAVPLGSAKVYKPRDYIIKGSWISEWLEANARVGMTRIAEPPKPKRRRHAGGSSDSLGPCPV